MSLAVGNMRIIADENIPFLTELFSGFGTIETCAGRTIGAELVRNADLLLVRSVTQVNQALLHGSSVKFVGTCTIGTDHMDLDYLQQRGIRWSNAPGSNANSVVEYVFSALALTKPDWLQASFGIVGCGNVGGLLYRRLTELGISAHCYDPLLSENQAVELCELNRVLQADVICLHAPLTHDGDYPSFHLLCEERLRRLKPGAVIISAGRGAVIDNQALKNVLQQRPDLIAVLDVWEPEPNLDLELLKLVRLGTAHIAGYSFDGKVEGSVMIYHAVSDFLKIKATHTSASLLIDNSDGKELPLAGDTVQELVNHALLSAYNPIKDDQLLRQLLLMPSHEDAPLRAKLFDSLRKDYAKRCEFRHYQVKQMPRHLPEAKKKSLRKALATLGMISADIERNI